MFVGDRMMAYLSTNVYWRRPLPDQASSTSVVSQVQRFIWQLDNIEFVTTEFPGGANYFWRISPLLVGR